MGKDAHFDAGAAGEVDGSGYVDWEGRAEGEACVEADSEDGGEDHVGDGYGYGEDFKVCAVASSLVGG